jgi:glutathione S-transferase
VSDRLVLYIGEKNVSSWSMRAWVALTEKDLPFEERTISLLADQDRRRRREIGPTGRVPVLHHLTEKGKPLVVPDSLAIIEYIDETYGAPAHGPLWPADRRRRAEARWLAAAMHSGFVKLREGMSFNLTFLSPPPPAPAAALADAAEMLGYWEDALGAKTETGPFLFGSFGAVDAMYAPAVVRLTAFKVPTDRSPKAAAFMKAVMERPSVRKWMDAARALPPVPEE